jgi:hypothetical protein
LETLLAEMHAYPFWAIVFMSMLGAWTMSLQGRRIWRAGSVAALAIPFAWFNGVFYFIVLLYGIDHLLWAMIINGILRGITMLPVMFGMVAFHAHSRLERAFALCFISLLAAMMALPQKDQIFLAFCLIGNVLFIQQPYKIIKEGRTGVLEVRVYMVALLNTLFYTWYGHEMDNALVMYTSLAFAIIITFTLVLFRVYPEHNQKAVTS